MAEGTLNGLSDVRLCLRRTCSLVSEATRQGAHGLSTSSDTMFTAVCPRAMRPVSNHQRSLTTTKPTKHTHQNKRAHSPTNLLLKAMWPFPGYYGYHPPAYGYYPPNYASTSCPDRRTNTRSSGASKLSSAVAQTTTILSASPSPMPRSPPTRR